MNTSTPMLPPSPDARPLAAPGAPAAPAAMVAASAGARYRGRACPSCGGATERVARHFLDRLLSVFIPVSRYRCRAGLCTWEGALQPRSSQAALQAWTPRRGRRLLAAARLQGSGIGPAQPAK